MTTLVPLDTFREVIGYHPWHFWQLANNTNVVVRDACGQIVRQHAWQAADAAGRQDVLNALEAAEAQLKAHLGYSIAPRFEADTLNFPKYLDTGQVRPGYAGSDGRWLSVKLPAGMVQAVGSESRTLIGSVTTGGGGLVFSDADGDNLNETFTATIATTVTDPEQIAVYFAAADRLDAAAVSEAWRIAPVKVTISGGTAVIKGRAWLVVRPILYEGVGSAEIDPGTPANFASTLEIYQYTANPNGTTLATAQGVLYWDTEPYPIFCDPTFAPNNATDPAAVAQAIARVGLRDARLGLVNPAEAVYSGGQFSGVVSGLYRPPDRALVRYRAGDALENGQVKREWAIVTVRLAAAELTRPISACDKAHRELYRWQIDAAASTEAARFNVSPGDLDNPFGTRLGHLYAWKKVQQLGLGSAVTF